MFFRESLRKKAPASSFDLAMFPFVYKWKMAPKRRRKLFSRPRFSTEPMDSWEKG